MKLADFDYDLPPERIAQRAVEPRDASRLLVLDRAVEALEHGRFTDLPRHLRRGDLLVVNDTRVIPARLHGERAGTGGKVECLLCRDLGEGRWEALVRAGGRLRAGEVLRLGGRALEAELLEKAEDGVWTLRLRCEGDLASVLERAGEVPLPPYIDRAADALDRERYQTIFAARPGAVAAPTAGLHMTPAVLAALEAKGVSRASVTLHVGPGTFRPIEADDPRQHRMHAERYEVPDATSAALERTRREGGRVVACGTTVVRALESFAAGGAREGDTRIFIFPGYAFRMVDALITNFHLPKSSLLLLVSALAGRERILHAYAEAVRLQYRFFSYGDAMLIL